MTETVYHQPRKHGKSYFTGQEVIKRYRACRMSAPEAAQMLYCLGASSKTPNLPRNITRLIKEKERCPQ